MIYVGPGQNTVPKELAAAYMKEHPNVTIEMIEGTNAEQYPKMLAQKQVDPNNPLINFGYFNASSTASGDVDDMWVALDPAKIPNMETVYPELRRADNRGVPWGVVGMGFLYNTDLVKELPTSWMDIFDPRFKGKVALFDYAFAFNGFLEVAHVLGGDIDETFRLFSEAAKNGQFALFYTSNAQAKDALVTGTALIEPFFTQFGLTWGPGGEGAPVAYTLPQEGMMVMPVYNQIVKGSTPEQIDAASEVINEFLSTEWLSKYCNESANIPATTTAVLDAKYANEPAFQEENVKNGITLDWAELAANNAAWRERWDREVKAYMS
jgi:putative spermidine/putrescine transport system substrate-binding protein